ncbi:glutaredoxin family protein [Ornithinimicrobium flavum]|uniref:glutaredoxin family protein n=1 Tax=Ornithinimicrobium flavum TaxID=1288636 RepID=UPI001930EC34|nr:glutaredoxin family protein [Ornithinimicrobium flavum]
MNRVTGARATTGRSRDPEPVPRATLLTTTACHLCEDAHRELRRRAERGELFLEVVSMESDEGRGLVATHRPAMFPLVLLDGRPLGHGRLSRRRLDAALRLGEVR